jgi:chaperonin GroEL
VQPFYQLMHNAGINPEVRFDAVLKSKKPGMGFDVTKPTDTPIDLKAAGIVDPVRVTKEAIQSAVSIAATAMTMGALVVDKPEKESAPAGGGMPGGGMGMM